MTFTDSCNLIEADLVFSFGGKRTFYEDKILFVLNNKKTRANHAFSLIFKDIIFSLFPKTKHFLKF